MRTLFGLVPHVFVACTVEAQAREESKNGKSF